MAADPVRCPRCGLEQLAGPAVELCPNCRAPLTKKAEDSSPLGPDVTTSLAGPGGGRPASRTPAGPAGGTASAGESGPDDAVTSEWRLARPDPDATTDGGPDSPPWPKGTKLRYFGDYVIHEELGHGGMGFVYRAKQLSLNRIVALKMIKPGLLADDQGLRRFQNEVEAVALLDHPGVVPIYEVGEHEGQRYFSMKLIEGGSLAQRLARFRDDPRAAVLLMIELAWAIQHAHVRGILHRDLKPANVLMDERGYPHITDFGLAKRIESESELTQSGAVLGTPAYMSPEQADGRRGAITTATDIYGLGTILYATLTGAGPFSGSSVLDTLDAVRTRPPEPPSRRNPKVPRDLELICLKCLEKDPGRRYASAGLLAEDLGRFLAGEPVSVPAAGAIERVAKWARRRPTLAAAYALGMLVLILGGLGALGGYNPMASGVIRAGQRGRREVDGRDGARSRGAGEVGFGSGARPGIPGPVGGRRAVKEGPADRVRPLDGGHASGIPRGQRRGDAGPAGANSPRLPRVGVSLSPPAQSFRPEDLERAHEHGHLRRL